MRAEVESDTITITRPSQERYQTLVAEMQKASEHLAQCEFLADLEATPGPDGLGYSNLLEFRFPKQRDKNGQIPRGVKLQQQIAGTKAVVELVGRQIEEWSAEEQAYIESQSTSA